MASLALVSGSVFATILEQLYYPPVPMPSSTPQRDSAKITYRVKLGLFPVKEQLCYPLILTRKKPTRVALGYHRFSPVGVDFFPIEEELDYPLMRTLGSTQERCLATIVSPVGVL